MKKTVLVIAILSIIFKLAAQDAPTANTPNAAKKKYWKFSGITGLNISQIGLWNWTGGGNNSGNAYVHANLLFTYKKNKLAWETTLNTEYGWMYTSDTYFGSQYANRDTKYPFRKSNDKIVLSSKFGYEFAKSWFVTILGSFQSQYDKGYQYIRDANDEYRTLNSNILSPSYTDMSLGIDWKVDSLFSAYISPVAGRITTCLIDSLRNAYGVDTNKTFKAAFGLTIKAALRYSPIKNLKIISTLTLFTPYRFDYKAQKALPYMDATGHQVFGNFDVDWDLTVSYTFLKVLSVSLSTSLKYRDREYITYSTPRAQKGIPKGTLRTGQRVQFREILAVGIGYSF
jgi:hypothetical protein